MRQWGHHWTRCLRGRLPAAWFIRCLGALHSGPLSMSALDPIVAALQVGWGKWAPLLWFQGRWQSGAVGGCLSPGAAPLPVLKLCIHHEGMTLHPMRQADEPGTPPGGSQGTPWNWLLERMMGSSQGTKKCKLLLLGEKLSRDRNHRVRPRCCMTVRQAGTWDPWLRRLHLDSRLLQQQSTKKL